jgi:hypothetical protein
MRSLLPKFLFAPAFVAAAALLTSSALAESTVNIPFNFTVAGKVWPAGKYDVQKGPLLNSVRLSSLDSSHNIIWSVMPGDPSPTDLRTVLTFDVLNDSHALRTIQFNSRVTPRLDKPAKEYTPLRIMAGE